MTFVITGVSGNTGGVVADTLLAQGQRVRVVVREREKAARFAAHGAEVAVADLGDTRALAAAFAGARAAYVLVPPNLAAADTRAHQRATSDSIAAALREARVPHAVLLSSIGAQHPAGTGPIAGLHHTEALLRALPDTRASFIRAAYFMENLGGSLGLLDQGLLPSFMPASLAIEMVATVDIGKLAAQTLVEGTAATQVIELAGPSKVSMADVAAAASKRLGKPITVAEAPTEAVVPTLTGFGMPADLAAMYREMIEGLIAGHVAYEGGHRTSRGATTVDTVLGALLGAGTPPR
ncbi:MAG: NmrA family NAD(P)-binding protein [Deltaproteobacteria bacterium]|nr:NmrA family NAD(P)-binding protein [Deltaproteobacteria bacterium]MBK8720289.1 NmrA family NAD(P)-binding protein [Deltaproteobacteria bacterium]MBP7287658.1 NmrA family NAD(P)-binding protein [Nannocystaceae bacterium]